MLKAAKRNVSNAKSRLTRAKNRGDSLQVLISLNRDREKAKAFNRVVFKYIHTLEDQGITDCHNACVFLKSKGVTW